MESSRADFWVSEILLLKLVVIIEKYYSLILF